MTRHYLKFSILILLLALAQISAMEPNRQQAESGSVLTVVPHILSDGDTTNLHLIPPIPEFTGETNAALLHFAVLENAVAYLRVGDVTGNLPAEIHAAQTALATTNKLAGTVLDLRFAGGDDSAAAMATADLFAAKKLPLAILVNGKTRGAAVALATSLRQAGDGLVLGGATADLKPDIAVTVKISEEKKYLENPYAALAQSETNAADTNHFGPFIDHTTEADLVREKIKDGDEDEDTEPPKPAEPQKPYIHDPVLARAVDLIQALAFVRQPHG